jgi:hypothetical protein
MTIDDKHGIPIDTFVIMGTATWLGVLAAPHLYRGLARGVDAAHIGALLDFWIAYVDRGDRYTSAMFEPVPYEQRPALARRLRELVATWTPPDLPAEITEAARALLHAEGLKWPQGTSWDDASFDVGDRPLESYLIWPEQLPTIMLEPAESGAAGRTS